ncbi:MAG: Peptidase protein [Ignavibacteria bacterium]|nr:Peptidase protein [Ignavibacteria bacterium]
MKKHFFSLVLILFLFCNLGLYSQSWLPVLLDERGDTIQYSWPPPDTSYSHHELIIKFRKTALNLEKLCYDYIYIPDPKTEKSKDKILSLIITDSLISYLMNQRFELDSLLTDFAFVNVIKSFGGNYLKRMTWANPCVDTLSITRLGNLIKCDDYLWMLLEFENDTNVINAALALSIYFQNYLDGASLNYYYNSASFPNDTCYTDNQVSLKADLTGVEQYGIFKQGDMI